MVGTHWAKKDEKSAPRRGSMQRGQEGQTLFLLFYSFVKVKFQIQSKFKVQLHRSERRAHHFQSA